jgi:hypothetical protein
VGETSAARQAAPFSSSPRDSEGSPATTAGLGASGPVTAS